MAAQGAGGGGEVPGGEEAALSALPGTGVRQPEGDGDGLVGGQVGQLPTAVGAGGRGVCGRGVVGGDPRARVSGGGDGGELEGTFTYY